MFKQYLALLVGRLLGQKWVIAAWEKLVHGLSGDWGFDPGGIESYDLAHNITFAIGIYRVDQVITEGLVSDYYDLYVQMGQQKWGLEIYEGTGHFYKLDTGAF